MEREEEFDDTWLSHMLKYCAHCGRELDRNGDPSGLSSESNQCPLCSSKKTHQENDALSIERRIAPQASGFKFENLRANASLNNPAVNMLGMARRATLPKDIIWSVLAIIVLTLIGLALIRAEYIFLWCVASLLVLLGAFLSVFWGAVVGIILILTALPWILLTSQEIFFRGETLIILAIFPILPLFLSAARVAQEQTSLLKMLLEIPQVRASLDVSDWSLLPTPRALDRRLMLHAEEHERIGRDVPAILFKIEFNDIHHSGMLLGETQLQLMTVEICDKMRKALRKGDVITEDMRIRGQIYILTFPNPDFPNNLEALTKKIVSILNLSSLPTWTLYHAVYPADGKHFNRMNWRKSI